MRIYRTFRGWKPKGESLTKTLRYCRTSGGGPLPTKQMCLDAFGDNCKPEKVSIHMEARYGW